MLNWSVVGGQNFVGANGGSPVERTDKGKLRRNKG
jgi:hypothetical protein